MTQEEKAKAYDEKLDVARHIYADPSVKDEDKYYIEVIFPELKESEDERMKNAAIRACKYMIDNFENSTKDYEDAIAWLEKQGEQKPNCCDGQKPAWSEEDEKILNLIIARLHSHPNVEVEEYGKDYHWLNSLENRVQPQPKQEWSEEDEETLKDIITSMTNLKDSATSDALRDIYNSKIDWLKSLRPHNQWKPSDEQMDALKSSTYCQNKQMSKVLFGLYQDLLKLRE